MSVVRGQLHLSNKLEPKHRSFGARVSERFYYRSDRYQSLKVQVYRPEHHLQTVGISFAFGSTFCIMQLSDYDRLIESLAAARNQLANDLESAQQIDQAFAESARVAISKLNLATSIPAPVAPEAVDGGTSPEGGPLPHPTVPSGADNHDPQSEQEEVKGSVP